MSNVLFDKDIIRHDRIIPGQAGDGMTLSEYAALRNDLDDLLARPVIDGLDAIPDVNAPAPADGDTLVHDVDGGPSGEPAWVPGKPVGRLQWVRDTPGPVHEGINQLWFRNGLRVEKNPDFDLVYVQPTYGTSANTVAPGNHTHAQPTGVTWVFPSSGTLSGGTRTLESTSLTGLNPSVSYMITGSVVLDLQGEGAGAGYTMLSLTLGSTRVDRPEIRTVSGVPRELSLEHGGIVVSGVSSVNVIATIAYDRGDPINIRAGRIVVHRRPYR